MSTPEDDQTQRLKNELLRAELEDKHDTLFSDDSKLSLKQEGDFLERMRDMEAGGPASYVSIGSLVGRKYTKRAAAKARARKYSDAIVEIILGLQMAGVVTDYEAHHLSPQAYYHWLINDLFAHTIPKPSSEPLNPNEPNVRHGIGVLYEQVVARQQREAKRN